jgi:hypothetical protein
MTHRKEAFINIFSKLVDVQNSYRGIVKHLSQRLHTIIPKTTEEVKLLDGLEQQVSVAERNIDKLEEVKFYCSLALLTEGALIQDNELTIAILTLEELIETARSEVQIEDEYIKNWAQEKMLTFEDARNSLLSVMTHKVDRKKEIGEIQLQ